MQKELRRLSDFHETSRGLGYFCSLGNEEPQFAQVMGGLLEKRSTRSEWLFWILSGEQVLARWGLLEGKGPQSLRLFGFAFSHLGSGDDPPFLDDTTISLFQKSLETLQAQKIRKIEYQLHSDDSGYSTIRKWLQGSGFQLFQQKKRFCATIPFSSGEWTMEFQPVSQLPATQFHQVFLDAYGNTLDRSDASLVEEWGEEEAARRHEALLRSMDDNPKEWFVGFVGGYPVGLVIPQMIQDTLGTINHIAVVPEHRGNGFGEQLLRWGMVRLQDRGAKEVVADVDALNLPMQNALTRNGFVAEKTIELFRCLFRET
ncbi:MAG TPA: GNAT family N-acetyltransferase [Thermotogota bacterium]|nr:GNAT family N-acetyltransferase [Thermotogota bacterium]